MGLVLFILFSGLCFVLPLMLYRKGKVSRLTVIFWIFFGTTAIINGLFMNFAINLLYGWSDPDDWVPFVGPALVQIPFGFMIYGLEKPQRKTVYALVVAVLGSFLVTGLWLLSSALFMH